MATAEQTKNAKDFSEYWKDKGAEKQEAQRYWIGLLQEVLGIENPSRYIEFEKPVKLSHASFIDGFINSTKVLIEQKGSKVDLTKAYPQSDGAILTPYQQAKRYADELPYDLRPRWIVVSNFKEIHIHDMNNPHTEPEIVKLGNLEKEYYRLQFLVDIKNEKIRREEEISLQAGILVGKLYDALIKEYINPDEKSLRSLNILCVRLVFCLYAEDAGFFESRTCFEDYVKSFNLPDLREGLIKLFKGLDTKLENRNPTDEQKAKIEKTAQAILDARAKYPESSLADLYDETFMPSELRKAHQSNDRAVMEAYGFAKDMTETEIVAELFKIYEKLTKESK